MTCHVMSWDYVLLAGHTPIYSDLTCRATMNTYKIGHGGLLAIENILANTEGI